MKPLRTFLNKNSAMVTIVSVVILIIALGAIILQSHGYEKEIVVNNVYYDDMNIGKIFIWDNTQTPPIAAASGPPEGKPGGLRAYLFMCGECVNFDGMTEDQIKQT